MKPRTAGLLAAAAVAFTGAVQLLRGDLTWVALSGASAATGLAAYLAAEPLKKTCHV